MHDDKYNMNVLRQRRKKHTAPLPHRLNIIIIITIQIYTVEMNVNRHKKSLSNYVTIERK